MEQFRNFPFDDLILRIGDIDTVELYKDDELIAYVNRENLEFLLERMGHNEKFYMIPKYFYIECINEVFHPIRNKHLYLLFSL